MGQDRLNALALLSIEAKLVQEIDYGDIIDVFEGTKKIYFLIGINKNVFIYGTLGVRASLAFGCFYLI